MCWCEKEHEIKHRRPVFSLEGIVYVPKDPQYKYLYKTDPICNGEFPISYGYVLGSFNCS